MASRQLRSSKVTPQQAESLLEKLAYEHLINAPNVIMQLDDVIHAFGKYTIHKTKQGYQIYRGATLAAETTTSRVAISWCVADKYNRYELALNLLSLESQVDRRQDEIRYFKYIIDNTKDLIKKDIASDRLAHSQIEVKTALEQLNKCLNQAKYCQQKGFKDETARFGIKSTNTTKSEGV